MEISKAELEILTELDRKIEYYKKRIEELQAEKRYFYNKGGSHR